MIGFARVRPVLAPLFGAVLGAIGAAAFAFVPQPLVTVGAFVLPLALTLLYGPVRPATAAGWRALFLSVAPRGLLLARLGPGSGLAVVVGEGLSRALVVLLAYLSRPAATEDDGVRLARSVEWWGAALVLLEGVALTGFCGWRLGFLLLTASAFSLSLGQRASYRLYGGVNADALAVFGAGAETAIWAAFVWDRVFAG